MNSFSVTDIIILIVMADKYAVSVLMSIKWITVECLLNYYCWYYPIPEYSLGLISITIKSIKFIRNMTLQSQSLSKTSLHYYDH